MTSYETQTLTTRNKSAASDQNDLKKLKSKYSAKLPTLKVLFSDWSDDDLLFVLEEANGDLDITIDRISEGHANQWGEVKTKKSKKEAQKAKAATTVSTNQQQSTLTSYRDTTPSKPTSTRTNHARTTPKATSNTPRSRTQKTQSWDKPSHHDTTSWDNHAPSGSWASIAKQHADTPSEDTTWQSNENHTVDEWSSSLTNDTTHDDDQPKTWASLLKSKPKAEHEEEEEEEVTTNTNDTHEWSAPTTTTTTSHVNTNSTDEWNAPTTEPVVNGWSTPVYEKPQETSIEHTSSWDEPEKKNVAEELEPVSSLDAKLNALTVEESTPAEETVKDTIAAEVKEEPVVAQTRTPPVTTTVPVTNDTLHQFKQQESVQEPQVPTQSQPQQPQVGMDHLTSAYSSYSQPPISGFGVNPMSVSDYGIYGTEAQRAAAMGYYDPTSFSHSPSVTSASTYQARDKYTQDLHGQTGQAQTIPQQQAYPPYYQYYYMPNQFNAYQQSTYGQFMNKYPNMYQQPGKPATSSPYVQQQQLYHQYDDLGLDYQKSSVYSQPQQLEGFLQKERPQQSQSQPQQQAYANYFGQPQMFSYGQYPQQFQQMPPQSQRQQQQYWNQ